MILILTNNPDAAEAALAPTELVKGTPLDVLTRARELIDQGYFLVTAPLAANNRLNRSPYRSVILSREKSWSGDDAALLDMGISHMALQGFSAAKDADSDYRWMDLSHLKMALEESAALGER